MLYDATRLPWVPLSPNMPTLTTALLYPGLGLLEGTSMSEGRGTCTPFQTVGAPWLTWRYAQAMSSAGLPCVSFREAYYIPTFSKWQVAAPQPGCALSSVTRVVAGQHHGGSVSAGG